MNSCSGTCLLSSKAVWSHRGYPGSLGLRPCFVCPTLTPVAPFAPVFPPDWMAGVPEYPIPFPPPELAQVLKPPHTLGTLPPVRSASEVSKLGEDPVQGLLPVGCVSVGGWSNWRDLLAHSLPGGWGGRGGWEEAGTGVAMATWKGSCQGGGGAVFVEGRDPGLQQRPVPRAGGSLDAPRQSQCSEFSHPRRARLQGSLFQGTACSLGTQWRCLRASPGGSKVTVVPRWRLPGWGFEGPEG